LRALHSGIATMQVTLTRKQFRKLHKAVLNALLSQGFSIRVV